MSDTERVIGKLEEFKNATQLRLDRIDQKLDGLSVFQIELQTRTRISGSIWGFVAGLIPSFLTSLVLYVLGK